MERERRRVLPAGAATERQTSVGERRRAGRDLQQLELPNRVGPLGDNRRTVVEHLAVGGAQRDAGAGFDVAEADEEPARDIEAAGLLDLEEPLLEAVRPVRLEVFGFLRLLLRVLFFA